MQDSQRLKLCRRRFLASVAALPVLTACSFAHTISGKLPWSPFAGDPPKPINPLGWYFFTPGEAATVEAIVDRLIDQWIVRSEAQLSRFPEPKEEEIDREVSRVVKSFSSAEEYEARKKQSGLSDTEIRKIVAAQLYLSNYLDSRFRPSVQIDEKAIEAFYQNAVVPRAKARGQEPPTLEASRDIIQDALVQSDITEQADRWLKESRDRLHVQKYLEEGTK